MKQMDECWTEAIWEEEQYQKQQQKRRRTREQRRQKARERMIFLTGVVLFLLVAILATTIYAETREPEDAPEQITEAMPAAVLSIPEEEIQEDYENEKIEAALVETGYFRNDIPLDFDTQACLRAACEESGVSFELALAVIRKETNYRNVNGDNGNSVGYMQVQPRWHEERMNRLGVTDLSEPLGNFRVGCDYLADLLDKYSMEEALTAYNSGKPGDSYYADTVIDYWRELRG